MAITAPAASHIASLFAAEKFELITSPSGGKPPIDFSPILARPGRLQLGQLGHTSAE
jgi:hypothetical protein